MPTETTPPTPPAPNPKGRANRAAALKGAALSRAFTAPTSPTVQGLTTIVFGSKDFLYGDGSGSLQTAICVSIDWTPKVEIPVVENGDGYEAARIPIRDGWDVKAECVYDSALTWPDEDDEILVMSPRYPNGLYFTLDKLPVMIKRKGEVMISLELANRPGINTTPPA